MREAQGKFLEQLVSEGKRVKQNQTDMIQLRRGRLAPESLP